MPNCDKCEHWQNEIPPEELGAESKMCVLAKCPLVIRDEVLEEAAKVADELDTNEGDLIAWRIRNLMERK